MTDNERNLLLELAKAVVIDPLPTSRLHRIIMLHDKVQNEAAQEQRPPEPAKPEPFTPSQQAQAEEWERYLVQRMQYLTGRPVRVTIEPA